MAVGIEGDMSRKWKLRRGITLDLSRDLSKEDKKGRMWSFDDVNRRNAIAG